MSGSKFKSSFTIDELLSSDKKPNIDQPQTETTHEEVNSSLFNRELSDIPVGTILKAEHKRKVGKPVKPEENEELLQRELKEAEKAYEGVVRQGDSPDYKRICEVLFSDNFYEPDRLREADRLGFPELSEVMHRFKMGERSKVHEYFVENKNETSGEKFDALVEQVEVLLLILQNIEKSCGVPVKRGVKRINYKNTQNGYMENVRFQNAQMEMQRLAFQNAMLMVAAMQWEHQGMVFAHFQ